MTEINKGPLKKIVSTRRGETVLFEGTRHALTVPTIIHKLECGHEAEPLVRVGCRLPYPPKRRRCRQCLLEEQGH
jgi:hypothetical protein